LRSFKAQPFPDECRDVAADETLRRVLFVDDEPQALQGLRALTRRHRSRWHSEFALGGEQAMALLASQAFDVIVTDMCMPKLDGAALLQHVHRAHPQIVRIVLSGYAEAESTLRAMPVAHQFLSKPCDARELEQVIERACRLQALLGDDALRRAVGQIRTLPSLPQVYGKLMALLSRPETGIAEVARLLERDIAISARVLQIVNSAFFGLPQRVSSVRAGLAYLGINVIKSLVLLSELFVEKPGQRLPPPLSLARLQHHAFLTGTIARRLMPNPKRRDDAYMAGMLHDIGKLILAGERPDYFARVASEAQSSGEPEHVVEQRLSGVTHADVGGYLLGIWGLPYGVVEAVANHHAPERVPSTELDLVACTHVANLLADERECRSACAGPLPCDYLAARGIDVETDRWRALAREVDTAVTGSFPPVT
jgi:HD-like signal output (HDOD) protein